MSVTPDQARAELARRELERRSNQDQTPVDQFASFPEVSSLLNSNKSLGGKAWDALKIPAQMSQRGLNSIAGAMPNPEFTGNLPMDLIKHFPKVEAEIAAEAAPGFINRASIVTAGASKLLGAFGKTLSPIGRGLATQAEDWAGIRPEGSLTEAAKDASLIFAPGKKAASPMYEAAKTTGGIADKLRRIPGKAKFLRVADKLADQGALPPENALEGRKIAGKLLDKGGGVFTEDYLRGLVDKFSAIAKSNENIAAGDVAHRRGLMANAIRSIAPKNVGGRASPFKVAEAMALAHLGPLGKAVGLMFSPLALGLGATGAGIAGRVAANPAASVAALQAFRKMQSQ